LNALRAFEAAARHRSFKAAAAELFVTPTAISHRIRKLEGELGFRVLDRTPREVTLTASGDLLYSTVSVALQDIGQTVGLLKGKRSPAGLTLSTTAGFLGQWLTPRLEALRLALPQVSLRLHASPDLVPLEPGGVEVAVRYGRGPFSGAESVEMIADAYTPVCSPRLHIRQMEDLGTVTLIHVDGQTAPLHIPTWARWCAHAGVTGLATSTGLRFNDSLHAMQAALAGNGVVLASVVLADDALKSGLLVRPFAAALTGASYHFAWAPGLADRPDIAALRSWFLAALAPDD